MKAPSFENQVKIYPNPTFGKFWIEIPDNLKIKETQLYNLSGSLQVSYDLIDVSKYEFEFNELPSGVYFLELKLNTGERIRKKVFFKKP